MVSLGEEDAATMFVCDSKTGVWSRSKILIGGAVTRSIELWQRKMYDDTLTQRQKDRVFSWSRSTRSELGRSHLQGSLPAALSIIQSEGKLTDLMEKGLVVCREEELNAEMRYIGTPNGVVDLEDGFLLTPVEAKKKLVTKSTRVEYKPMIHLEENEHASDVRGLMFHLSQEESDWIEGYIGHALWGSPDGWAWLVGAASSGKTTLIEAIHSALGDYVFAIPRKMLKKQQFDQAHDEGLQMFMDGTRLAIASDILSNVDMESDLVKGLATGDINIGRRAHGRFEGQGKTVTASMVFAFNEGQTPRIEHTDSGFMRRLRVLRYPPLDPSIMKPKEYRDSFKTNMDIREHVLAWLIDCAMQHKTIPPTTPGWRFSHRGHAT